MMLQFMDRIALYRGWVPCLIASLLLNLGLGWISFDLLRINKSLNSNTVSVTGTLVKQYDNQQILIESLSQLRKLESYVRSIQTEISVVSKLVIVTAEFIEPVSPFIKTSVDGSLWKSTGGCSITEDLVTTYDIELGDFIYLDSLGMFVYDEMIPPQYVNRITIRKTQMDVVKEFDIRHARMVIIRSRHD